MFALLLAASLGTASPQPVVELETLIRHQRAAVLRDIRIDIQADLEHRGARFFAAQGELRELLDGAVVVEAELAAR